MPSYKFFKDTGIQYFGNDDIVDFSRNDQDTEPYNDRANLQFSFHLFANEWLPFSLDGQRNLLRLYYNTKIVIFAIDTTIRSNDPLDNFPEDLFRYSLVENDIAGDLDIHNDYRGNADTNLFESIADNEEIRDYVKHIYDRKRIIDRCNKITNLEKKRKAIEFFKSNDYS